MKKPGQTTLTKRRSRWGFLFIAPFLVGFLAIFIPCIVQSLWYSFNEVYLNSGGFTVAFCGWDNYYRLFFVDTDFRVQLLTALKSIVVDTLMIMVFSFFVANVLNQKFIGRGLARAILFLPVILATGLISSVENNDLVASMYGSASSGAITGAMSGISDSLLNMEDLLYNLLSTVNTTVVTFLADSVKSTTDIINASGVQILIFIAALQSIPQSVFEAAKVEGATPWQEFWKITFPMLTPMLLVNLVYTIIDTFVRPSYGILKTVQDQAFLYNRMGFASAISWVFFVMIGLVLLIVAGTVARRVQYND